MNYNWIRICKFLCTSAFCTNLAKLPLKSIVDVEYKEKLVGHAEYGLWDAENEIINLPLINLRK